MQAITKEESKKWKKKSRQTERVAKQDLKETMSLRQHPVEVTDSELKGITEAVEQDHKEPAKPQHHHVEITDSVITSNAEAASQQGMTNGRKEGAKALRLQGYQVMERRQKPTDKGGGLLIGIKDNITASEWARSGQAGEEDSEIMRVTIKTRLGLIAVGVDNKIIGAETQTPTKQYSNMSQSSGKGLTTS